MKIKLKSSNNDSISNKERSKRDRMLNMKELLLDL